MPAPVYTSDLSPWCRLAVGDAITAALPRGYRITGTSGSGTTVLHLYGPRWEHLVTQRVPTAFAPATYRGLVDMAHVDLRERTVVVTADGQGWVTSITDGGAA